MSSVYGASGAICAPRSMSHRYGMSAMQSRTRPGASAAAASERPAALAEAATAMRPASTSRVLRGRLERAHGVGVEAPEVVRLGRGDAARHHAGVLGARGACARIAGRAGQPLAALTTRVHDEHGVPGGREERVIDREGAAAAVADVGHEAGQRAGRRRAGAGTSRGSDRRRSR